MEALILSILVAQCNQFYAFQLTLWWQVSVTLLFFRGNFFRKEIFVLFNCWSSMIRKVKIFCIKILLLKFKDFVCPIQHIYVLRKESRMHFFLKKYFYCSNYFNYIKILTKNHINLPSFYQTNMINPNILFSNISSLKIIT